MDPVSPDPAKCEQIARVQQDLFDIFRHPDHITPPPSAVPEGDGPVLPLQIDDEGTSNSEGDACDNSEGAPVNEGAPDNPEQAAPSVAPPPIKLPKPVRKRGIRFVDKLEQRARHKHPQYMAGGCRNPQICCSEHENE
jgi:hypothetical protein